MKRLFLICLILISFTAQAEYRAYELLIINPDTGVERTVTSTFDHLQYPSYYPLARGEIAQYVRSWMCWGSTADHTALCPAPEEASPKPNSGLDSQAGNEN